MGATRPARNAKEPRAGSAARPLALRVRTQIEFWLSAPLATVRNNCLPLLSRPAVRVSELAGARWGEFHAAVGVASRSARGRAAEPALGSFAFLAGRVGPITFATANLFVCS